MTDNSQVENRTGAPTVWVLVIDNDGGTAASVHASEALAMQSLVAYCDEFVECFTLEGVPSHEQCDSISEQMSAANEWFVLQPCQIDGETLTAKLHTALDRADDLLSDLRADQLDEAKDVETLAMIWNALEDVNPSGYYKCTGCNRPEEECSEDPCPAVEKERSE